MTGPSRTRCSHLGTASSFTAHEGDVEALALAVPTAALEGSTPRELTRLLSGANAIFAAAGGKRWQPASANVERMRGDWAAVRARGVPPRLVAPTNAGLASLSRAVAARDSQRTRNAALDVAQAALDLELSYRPPAQIDRARFDLWLRQALVDGAARDRSAVSGDLATLEWIRDRIAHTLDSVAVTRIDTHLEKLRDEVVDGDLAAASRTAVSLRRVLATARPRG